MKKAIFAFLFGATAGSIVTWLIAKDYYEKRERESIESVKEVFGKTFKPKEDENEDKTEPQTVEEDHPEVDINKYAKLLSQEEYVNYSNSEVPVDDKPKKIDHSKPYVIAPEQFQEYDDYTVISLTYFEDGVLTDENFEIMKGEDVENSVGSESLTHFGEYEDDSVYVRNERLKVDYEILKDQRTYAEVVKSKPYLMEDYDAT